jgi:hypothetical protein
LSHFAICNDLYGSEKGVSKVLKIKKTQIITIYYMMRTIFGLIYNELEDYGNAIVYHNKALASIDKKLTASFRNQSNIL